MINPILMENGHHDCDSRPADMAGEVTLRDLFAGFALAGMAANPGSAGSPGYSELAADAYGYADAMLRERAK